MKRRYTLEDNWRFGRRLFEIRKEKKLRQWQLAEMLGCSHTTIGGYESGRAMPKEERINKLCWILKVSRVDLMPMLKF
jgi:transcriptional regulator with XRE-family HTH domain